MSCLHVVVAHSLHVVAHEVAHRCRDVFSIGLLIIIICDDGLSLQHVAGVHQQQTVTVDGAERVDVRRHTCERAVCRLLIDEVVREESSVHVGRLYHSYLYSLVRFASCIGGGG